MAVNKVVFGDQTIMDISDSTVNANNLLSGVKAYGANGEAVTGAVDVNDGTLTIQQNGTTKGTFTANQSGNTTVELTDTVTEIFIAGGSKTLQPGLAYAIQIYFPPNLAARIPENPKFAVYTDAGFEVIGGLSYTTSGSSGTMFIAFNNEKTTEKTINYKVYLKTINED